MSFSMTYTSEAVTLVMRPDVAWAIGSVLAFGFLSLGFEIVAIKDQLIAAWHNLTRRFRGPA